MNTKEGILRMFREGKSQKEIIELYSRKSYYRYVKLWKLIKLKERLQWLIDSDGWDSCNLPELKQVDKEVRKW